MFSTRLLTQFVAVAEELHFGRAAARVNMAQSPLSHAIRKLEESLDVALFVRNKRSVSLTAAGEVLLHQARAQLRAEDTTVAMVRHAQKHGAARLAIGFVGNVTYGIVPQLLGRFRSAHPQIHVDISEMLTRDLLHALSTGQLDVGIVRPPFQQAPELRSQVIGTDRFVLALPGAHPRAQQAQVSVADLADEPFVAYSIERVPVLHAATVSLCMEAGFYPNIVCQAWQATSILSFVAAGIGVALVPSHLQVFQHAGVAYRQIQASKKSADLKIAVVWREEGDSPSRQAFLGLVLRGQAVEKRGKRAARSMPP